MFKVVLAFLTMYSVVFSSDTTITLTPYSTGVLSISGDINFSNGVKIHDATYKSMPSLSGRVFTAIAFTDTVSTVNYQYSNKIRVDTSDWRPPHKMFFKGMSKETSGVPSVWDNALQYPDTLADIDSVITAIDTTVNDSVSYMRIRSVCTYSDELTKSDSPCNGFNSIVFIKAGKYHMKVQVFVEIDTTANDDYFIRWAVDSLGNGIFKKDKVAISDKLVPKIHYNKLSAEGVIFYDVFGRQVKRHHSTGVFFMRINGVTRKIMLMGKNNKRMK